MYVCMCGNGWLDGPHGLPLVRACLILDMYVCVVMRLMCIFRRQTYSTAMYRRLQHGHIHGIHTYTFNSHMNTQMHIQPRVFTHQQFIHKNHHNAHTTNRWYLMMIAVSRTSGPGDHSVRSPVSGSVRRSRQEAYTGYGHHHQYSGSCMGSKHAQ